MDYNQVLNIGASQSSIYGDVTNTANLMIYDNLKQAGLTIGRSKVSLNDNYQVTWVDGINLSYMRNFDMNSTTLSLSRMKPLGKWGTVGLGINYSFMFGKDDLGNQHLRWVLVDIIYFYINMVKVNNRITYSPTLIMNKPNFIYTKNG